MVTVRLLQIKLRAFRSFVEETVIDFPADGLVLLKGRSGSGKTSILLGIAYLVGHCPYPATELQSWFTEDQMRVVGTFLVNDKRVVISRGGKLTVEVDGQLLEGSAKDLEKAIDMMFGVGVGMRSALTYRGQGEPGLFLSLTDSQKKEFLTELLGLERFEKAFDQSQSISGGLKAKLEAQRILLDKARADLSAAIESAKRTERTPTEGIENQISQALSVQTAVSDKVTFLKNKISEAKRENEKLIQAEEGLSEPILVKMEADILDAKGALERLLPVQSTPLLEALTADLVSANEFLDRSQEEDRARLAESRSAASKTRDAITAIEIEKGSLTAKKQEEQRLVGQILLASEDLCDKCGRQWDKAKGEKVRLEERLVSVRADIARITSPEKDKELTDLHIQYKKQTEFVPNPEIEELRGIVANLRTDIAVELKKIESINESAFSTHKLNIHKLELAMANFRNELAGRVSALNKDWELRMEPDLASLEDAERTLDTLVLAMQGLRDELARIQTANSVSEARAEMAAAAVRNGGNELASRESSLLATTIDLDKELDFQKLIGREGFLGSVFSEILWEIGDSASIILGSFGNTQHITVSFTTETESQKGTVRKTIVPIIDVGGHQARFGSGTSGGQKTAVHLAVDVALAGVVSRRTGVHLGWLILDEAFDGLGPKDKESVMGILKSISENKTVLVVDHASEFQELFSKQIIIENRNGKSYVMGGEDDTERR